MLYCSLTLLSWMHAQSVEAALFPFLRIKAQADSFAPSDLVVEALVVAETRGVVEGALGVVDGAAGVVDGALRVVVEGAARPPNFSTFHSLLGFGHR